MNRYVAQGDGFPADNDFLMFIQSIIGEAATLSNIAGDNCILTGCVDTAGTVSDGYMILAGEIVKFNGGALGTQVHIVETIEQATYLEDIAPADGQGDDKDAYFTRTASFGNTGDSVTNWADIPRLTPITEIQKAMNQVGMVTMWAGDIGAIPAGWALCDGTNGTPDLSGKFIVGYESADADYDAIGNQGGEKEHTLLESEMPNHSHSGTTNSAGAHTHSTTGYLKQSQSVDNGGGSIVADSVGSSPNTGSAGAHSHTITMNNTGGGGAHENRPPFFTLAFIQFKGV